MISDSRKRGRLAVVDLGQSKFAAAIAEKVSEHNHQLVGFGESDAAGMEKGKVINIEGMVGALKGAIHKAEVMSGSAVDGLYVGISGTHMRGNTHQASTYIAGETVTPGDVDQVMKTAQAHQLMERERILHVLEQSFSINRHNGIKRPVGMEGDLLEGTALVISMNAHIIGNVERCFERTGHAIHRVVSNHVASSTAVLRPEEKDLGTIVVDFGAGVCDIAVFRAGSLAHIDSVGQGGNDIDADLSQIYRVSAEQARGMKHDPGSGIAGGGPSRAGRAGANEPSMVVRSRVDDIVRELMGRIEQFDPKDFAGGIVLTGGGALLEGLDQVIGDASGMPVRIGVPAYAGKNAELLADPRHSSVAGLIDLCSHDHEGLSRAGKGVGRWLRTLADDLFQVGK